MLGTPLFITMTRVGIGKPVQSAAVSASSISPDAELTDPTLFVDMSRLPAGFWAAAAADGGNVQVWTAGGTRLPMDLILFDHDTDTGFLAFKYIGAVSGGVSVEIICDGQQTEHPAVDSEFGQYNAYDDNWIAFYPNGGADEFDRTIRENHLTLVGLPATPSDALVTGIIGVSATNYRTVDTLNNFGSASAFVPNTYPATIIAVVQLTASQSIDALGMYNAAGGHELRLQPGRSGGGIQAQMEYSGAGADESASSELIAVDTDFHHFAGVATDDVSRDALLDGNIKGSNTDPATVTGLTQIVIGKGSRSALSSSSLNGNMCLAQIHDTVRSDEWLAFQAAMLDQSTFWGDWE